MQSTNLDRKVLVIDTVNTIQMITAHLARWPSPSRALFRGGAFARANRETDDLLASRHSETTEL